MRNALILAATLAACASPAAPGTDTSTEAGLRYISIGSDAVATARTVAAHDGAALQILETAGDISVLAIDAGELEALSQQMHEQHHRCGGFVVHESLDEARQALSAGDAGRTAVAVDYTLDRADVVNAVLPVLDAQRILGTIKELSSAKNRYYQSESGAAASIWLRDRWRSFSARPEVTLELFDHGYAQKSVILTIPGTTRANEVVVIGGHLDSIAVGGKSSKAPGADDDASGIATLTEIARGLLARDFRPERTVQFIAYAAEEVGLRGSQGIVRDYKKRGIDVVGALQLDMTNYQGSEKDIWLMKDFTNAAQNTFLTQLIDTYVGATWGLDACGYACSDHASWYRAGVPASMPFESRMRDRNRTIHSLEDTLEVSGNNAAHALKFARLGAAFAIELGKGELAAAMSHEVARPAPERSCDANRSLAGLLALGLLSVLALAARLLDPSRRQL